MNGGERSANAEFAVVIPTWRRPAALRVCLCALAHQTLPPARVLIAFKAGDTMTAELLVEPDDARRGLTVTAVIVAADGNFASQLDAGIAATTEAIVVLTDDDAEPRPDWLARMAEHFRDPTVAGVGGRDWQEHDPRERAVVGKVGWYGRVVGNHHLGVGPAREVDLLKGVNCAFRGPLIREIGIDLRLRGPGNVTHTEMSLCFALRRRGCKLIYDPAVAVEHHTAVRHDGDVNARGGFESRSFIDAVHNETLALLEHLPPVRRAAFFGWALVVGTGAAPGLLQLPRLLLKRSANPFVRWGATVRGRFAGMATFSRIRSNQASQTEKSAGVA